MSVRLGEHNLLTEPDCEDGECADPVIDVPIAERIIHVSYDPRLEVQPNDIALIRLSHPVCTAERYSLISCADGCTLLKIRIATIAHYRFTSPITLARFACR